MLGLNKLLACLVLILTVRPLNCDMFTSLSEMVKLVETSSLISSRLESALSGIQIDNSGKKFLDEFKSIANYSKSNPEIFIGNPVNSFLLIKLLSKDFNAFSDSLKSNSSLMDLIDQIKKNYPLPTDEDYKGSIVALHRLEDTYLLKPSDIRKGNLNKNYPSRNLTAFECFELGRVAYENKDYYHTINWMIEAYEQHKIEGDKSQANLIDIYDYLAFSSGNQGNIKHALELYKIILKLQPGHKRVENNIKHYSKMLESQMKAFRGDVNEPNQSQHRNPSVFKNTRAKSAEYFQYYEKLCREHIPLGTSSNLKCRYIHHTPYLYIAPVKEEQVFEDPAIWVYHDVITEKQLQIMKLIGTPKLNRAIVRNPTTGVYETANYRISKSGWIKDTEHEIFPYLTNLVESITNLSLKTAEEWQIANYGIGGQYEPHFDFSRKSEPGETFNHLVGNRIATWLFYLEVPEQGGATVFTRIGAKIKPKRRSAVFWYNLLPSGDGDFRTRHAACPVLYGTKWVSNKWIHSGGQEFKRPCNLIKEFTEDV